jgi:diguanylate cyclase (GGDEF)-like protein/PAS domain S-box-containing protein
MKQLSKSPLRSLSIIGKRALQSAVITGCLMCVFEGTKTAFFPHIQIWASHLLTILFVTAMVAASSFAVLKWNELLRLEMASSEERYRLLFERSLAGAYRTSVEGGEVLDCNVSFCQMFGYESREEVIGNSVEIGYLNPADRIRFIETLKAEKHVVNFEQRLRRKDGRVVSVLNSATLLTRDDGTGGVIKGTLTDITELRNAELQNRRLAAIVRCSDDAILSLTLESWNRGAERIYGYTAEEAVGRPIGILAPGDRSNETLGILQRVAQGDEVSDLETIRVTKDGRKITVALSISPLTDSAGVVIGASTIARDITERKRSEETLHRSEVQYRLLFESNPFPMWVFDRKTLRFLAVNKAAVRQYGFSREEFLAMTIADIRPEEDVADLLKDIEKRTHGLQKSGVWRHRRKNGVIIDVEIVCHHLDFQGVDAMLVAAYDVTERKQAAEALMLKTALLEAQSETTIDGILAVDESDRILLANNQFRLHFSMPEETMRSGDDRVVLKHFTDQVENSEAFLKRVKYLYAHPEEKSRDEFRLKDGRTFDRYSSPLINGDGRRRGRIWYFRDITEQKRAETAVRHAEEKYRAIFEDSVVGIFQTSPEGRPISINRALAQLHGFDSPEQLIAEVSNVAEQLFVDPNRMIELAKIVAEEGVVRGAEVEVYAKDRKRKWVLVNLRAVRTAWNDIAHYEGTVEDITERKAAEARIQYLAFYDALTELPHRALLQDRLGNALADAKRRDEKVALLFLDLDRFKVINDSFGHSFGDLVLKEVANRLKECTRVQDTVARVGGDEFLIMLSGVEDAAAAAVAANRVMRAMSAEFAVHDHSLSITCSIGISIFPAHGEDGESLIKNADAAMHSAKEAGRNLVRFFTNEMNGQAAERLTLESGLRTALDRSEFFLVYQPQMDVSTGRITGFEALIRWNHPKLGLVPPDRFVPIAEDTGLILPIGEWVLRTACAQAKAWHDDGLWAVPIAVNVSAVQFRQENFCALVRRALEETGLSPQFLELELTESLLLSNSDVTSVVLQELREMGLKLAIDDFGTGYSSLSYLKQFRVNKLKIDRSFIRDLAFDSDDAAITAAIISMAKSLNLRVIAEGVETEAQISILREHQCDEIQGYYFSKPITAAEVPERLLCATAQAKLIGDLDLLERDPFQDRRRSAIAL